MSPPLPPAPAAERRVLARQDGMRPPLVMLLTMPEVQEELALSVEQQKQVGELQRSLQEQMRSSFESLNSEEMQGLGAEQREQRFAEMRKKAEDIARQVDEKAGTILTEQQKAKFATIREKDFGAGPRRPQPGGDGGWGAALEAVKSQIRASDEEWKVIGPKLRKLVAVAGPPKPA